MENKPRLQYLGEPFLSFSNGQKAIDPRDGLMLFAPFSYPNVQGIKTIGIIGPESIRNKMIVYLKRMHMPIVNSERVLARPNFPGLETVFGISINFNNIVQLNVKEQDINDKLKFTDSHQRIYGLVNLYFEKLKDYSIKEETPVDLWFVIIPEEIYQYGRPNSRIPKSEDNVADKIKTRERDSQQPFLFDDFQKKYENLNIAYRFEKNFHNQLKARVLELKYITQIIRSSKIPYETEMTEEDYKFDTVKAWNISTSMYYKLGGLPWKLSEIREGVCYLGLVFKKLKDNIKDKTACCAAQMFLDSGDGMVFRGNVGPWYNPDTEEFHLSKKDAKEILNQSLQAYYDRFKFYPKEIFIHAKTFFDDIEWNGFQEAVSDKSNIIGIRIRQETSFKLYRLGEYCVPRGMMLQYDKDRAYLWTNGFIPRYKTQIGLETPNPINIIITRGNAEIEIVCKDILSLTKLNYNACIYGDSFPVTLKFADKIGEILTAGKDIKTGVLPFKHYI